MKGMVRGDTRGRTISDKALRIAADSQVPAKLDGGATPPQITIVLNWFEELRRLVPIH